jgi:hypothetical protein
LAATVIEADEETCAYCGVPTKSGIYVRDDPAHVMFPRERKPVTGFARDAGDICHICGQLVTWTDHLPPPAAGYPVRCFVPRETLGHNDYGDYAPDDPKSEGFHGRMADVWGTGERK